MITVQRQDYRALKRGEKSSRSAKFLVFALYVLFSIVPATLAASPELTKAAQDAIDLCTHSTDDRAAIARKFEERGWIKFRPPYSDAIPLLLADGGLLHAFVDKQRNSFGLDTKTGIIPDMAPHLETIAGVSQRGVYDAFWWDRESTAILIVFGKSRDDLRCRFFSSSKNDATEILSAITDYESNPFETKFGPVRVVTIYTYGDPPHQPFTGAAGLFVKLGILVDRPLLEPQLGAGPATTQFYRFDEDEFEASFERKPNVAFALETKRANWRRQ